jgi:hypothetical protein
MQIVMTSFTSRFERITRRHPENSAALSAREGDQAASEKGNIITQSAIPGPFPPACNNREIQVRLGVNVKTRKETIGAICRARLQRCTARIIGRCNQCSKRRFSIYRRSNL